MKILFWIAFSLFALILIMALVGMMLPKAHSVTRMARFKQPPEALFASIPEITLWQPLPPDGGPRKWAQQIHGRTVTFEEVASDPPRLFHVKIADKNLPYAGEWIWQITPTPDGCTCRIIENGEVYNPIFRFLGQLVFGYTKTIDAYLRATADKFNEPAQIEK
jgi:Polyketide cyclase / dehydrase and lipid transport